MSKPVESFDTSSLPPLTAPPSYATTDPAIAGGSSLPAYQTARRSDSTGSSNSYFIVKTSASGFDVLPSRNAEPIYHMNRPGAGVYMYRGSDNRGPRVAQARLKLGHSRTMDIYVGNSRDPEDHEWGSVRHSKEGGGFLKRSIEMWRFDLREPAIDAENGCSGTNATVKRKLAWQSSHGNFVLVDEESDIVLAEHNDKSLMGDCGYGSTLGITAWRGSCSETVEVAALVTLMAILERRRGGARQVGKAIGSQVGGGHFGPTTVAM